MITSIITGNFSESNNFTLDESKGNSDYNQRHLRIYEMSVVLLVIAGAFHAIHFFLICMRASRNLHTTMFYKLLRAQPRFFDVNSSGRILNRFSKDIGCIDEILPLTLYNTKTIFAEIICLLLITIYVSPYVAIPTGFFGIISLYVRRLYLKTSRPVIRLEGITKSPIFSHLSSSLNGLASIRAFKAEDIMIDEFDYHQDIHSSAFFLTIGTKVLNLSFFI